MADRKAVNKYYPPDWEPKHGSINKYRGQHPLRERAKKISEGILVVRFEMPYNVWCTSCDAHIGKGVRYNAEKKQAGNYFSTKIWSFRMKCHLCSAWMEIQTDPANRDYKMVSGVKQKTETREESETVELPGFGDKKVITDPFERLEHKTEDRLSAEKKKPRLVKLLELNETKRDDFSISQKLRLENRQKKKEEHALKEESHSIGLNQVILLPKDDNDLKEAKSINYSKPSFVNIQKDKKLQIKVAPIIASQTHSKTLERKKIAIRAVAKARQSNMKISLLHSPSPSKTIAKEKKSLFPLAAKR